METAEKIICDGCRKHLNDDYPEDFNYINRLKIKLKGWNLCEPCAKKRYLEERVEYYNKVIKEFAHLVNNCAFDHDGIETDAVVAAFFKEHRQLQNDMIAALHKIFGKIGEGSGNLMFEDPRNQWALSWCKQVSKLY